MSFLFTSESVSEGHPDKICDAISDNILDAIFEKDTEARVACESFVTTGLVLVGGEVTTTAYIEVPDVVRQTIKNIGYNSAEYRFDSESCSVLNSIHSQSPDIAMGVDRGVPEIRVLCSDMRVIRLLNSCRCLLCMLISWLKN